MQRLPIQLVEPGMRASRPVVSDAGITLVKENTEFTQQLIVRLENMRVSSVLVKGTPVQLKDYLPKSLEARLEDLDLGFSKTDNPTMRKLRVLLKAHFINKDKRIREEEADLETPEAASPPDDTEDGV